MKLNGLQNVGRATLLASFNQLGDDARAGLRERYSVTFQVTLDENGNAKNASGGVNQTGNWDDTVAVAVSYYYPVGTAAAIFYEVAKLSISEAQCQDKIDKQIEKAKQAYRLLPGVLIAKDEQLSYITASYNDASQKFSSTLTLGVELRQKLEDELKAIFAYNAQRIVAAHAILTSGKVSAIQKAFGSGSHLDSLLDSGAIIKLASDIGTFNAAIASRQRPVISSCADVRGAEAIEDQLDGLQVAAGIYGALALRTGLAPLAPLLDSSRLVNKDRSDEAQAIRSRLAARNCALAADVDTAPVTPVAQAPTSHLFDLALSRAARRRATAPATQVLHKRLAWRNALLVARLDAPAVSGALLCNLSKTTSGNWSCSGGDQSYDGSLDNHVGVAAGANDGGYAQDNRQFQLELGAATRNMMLRIAQLQDETRKVDGALPEWRDQNMAALAQYETGAVSWRAAAEGARATFASTNAPHVTAAKSSVDEFLTSPFDPAKFQKLVQKAGGAELTLPAITVDVMVPDLPPVFGITAADRLFGANTSTDDRRAIRESAKDDLELGDSVTGALAKRELSLAKQFAGRSTSTAQEISRALLGDAKSLRYAKRGEIAHARYSTDDGGRLASSDLASDSVVPPQSILARGDAFNASSLLLQQRAHTVSASLNPSDANFAQRATLVQSALTISAQASGLFYSGDLDNGERGQQAAFAILDLATRFVPGVNWGRDVYEAISGKDLFTGQELSVAARATAILGAVTVGAGDEVVGIAHAFDEEKTFEKLAELGMGGERAREILDTAKSMKAESFEFTTHILDEMKNEPLGEISRAEVKDAIDRGSKWWNSAEETVVALEKDAAPGEVRVGVAIDIDNGKLATAYREPKSDAVLRSTPIGDRGRYIQLTK
jgi:hypothetical protein